MPPVGHKMRECQNGKFIDGHVFHLFLMRRNGFTPSQIYSLDDAECSELCFCGDTLVLTCHALCVPFTPCRTALAFYSHASPAFQAFRGRCLCYSGNFICMRPQLGEFILPGESSRPSSCHVKLSICNGGHFHFVQVAFISYWATVR